MKWFTDTSCELAKAHDELTKEKRRICKVCGVNFKAEGKTKSTCSDGCQKTAGEKVARCKGGCKKIYTVVKEVTFKNNTKHLHQSCSLCRFTKYIPRKQTSALEIKTNSVSYAVKVMQKKYGKSFYTSEDWLKLRYLILSKSNKKCGLCKSSKNLHVDHIKPRSKYPELALDINNLQVLCDECNIGKSNIHEDDWRTK